MAKNDLSNKRTSFCSYFLAHIWTRGHWTETEKGFTLTIDIVPSFHWPFPRPPNEGLYWLCLRPDKNVANAAPLTVFTPILTSQPDTCVHAHAGSHDGSRVRSIKLSWSKMQTGPKLNLIPLTFSSPPLKLSALIHQPSSFHTTAVYESQAVQSLTSFMEITVNILQTVTLTNFIVTLVLVERRDLEN